MSSRSAGGIEQAPRRGLNLRQAETVEKLLQAGLALLHEVGHDTITIRMVATKAGVSPATAYTYLASKNHLFAELFLRQLTASATPTLQEGSEKNLQAAIRHLTDQITAEPELAAAVTPALLGTDPDVARLRLKIGAHFVDEFETALGARHPELVEVITLTFSGALLQAGMGLMTYDEMADRLDAAVRLILRGNL